MALPLFPPELFTLIGINAFLAVSLLTSLFDERFPVAVPYVYEGAALAGFGQIWISYVFLFSSVEARFWCGMLYLAVALVNIFSVNVYVAVNKKLLKVAGAFLATVTIPMAFASFVSISNYVNGLPMSLPPLPIVPVESIYIVLTVCVVILGLSVAPSLDLQTLRKNLKRRSLSPPSLCLNQRQTPTLILKAKKDEKGGENGNG